jgi:hypothetical protein
MDSVLSSNKFITNEMRARLQAYAMLFNLNFSLQDFTRVDDNPETWELTSDEGVCILAFVEPQNAVLPLDYPVSPRIRYSVAPIITTPGSYHEPPDAEIDYPEGESLTWPEAILKVLYLLVKRHMNYIWEGESDRFIEEGLLDFELQQETKTFPEETLDLELLTDNYDLYRDRIADQNKRILGKL